MKIYEGRPDHNEGRLEKELAVYDLLDELEIAYERVDHEALQTIEACREVDETLGISICKNLFCAIGREHPTIFSFFRDIRR